MREGGSTGVRSQADPARTGCSVPEFSVIGGSVPTLDSHPLSQIRQRRDLLPDRLGEGKKKGEGVTFLFSQSTALVTRNTGHAEQYLVLLLSDSR